MVDNMGIWDDKALEEEMEDAYELDVSCPFNNDICYQDQCQLWKESDCSINWIGLALTQIANSVIKST